MKVKYLNLAMIKSVVNIFTKILHADRSTTDMKHIKGDLSSRPGPAPWVDLRGRAKAKIQLFQNMVMLHIK